MLLPWWNRKYRRIHYHNADLSESIELLKCLSGTFCLECVSKIKSVLSIIYHAIYGAVRLSISLMMIVRICVLYLIIKIKSEVWPHLPLFRVRSWNNGMRCMTFNILIITGSCLLPHFYTNSYRKTSECTWSLLLQSSLHDPALCFPYILITIQQLHSAHGPCYCNQSSQVPAHRLTYILITF